MFEFLSKTRRACRQAQKMARQNTWNQLSLPHSMERGQPDPERAGVRYIASVYDIPTGVRTGFTQVAWAIAWRYLEGQEDGRRIALSDSTWAIQGSHSGRLLALEGLMPMGGSSMLVALNAWVALEPAAKESNRQILQRIGPHCADLFRQAQVEWSLAEKAAYRP